MTTPSTKPPLYSITFTVPRVCSKSRPRSNFKTGSIYTPTTTRSYEREIAYLCKAYMRQNNIQILTTEVAMELIIYCKNAPAKPDIDNIAKAVLDALNGIAYVDDKQVTDLHIKKIAHKTKRSVEVELWSV